MPKFFFDFRDGARRTRDAEGLDLANAESAKREAMVAVVQVLQLEESDDDHRVVECRVRDTADHEVYSICLAFHGEWATDERHHPRLKSISRI